ncbi:MAG: class I SAM-dependent methyltransferase [Chloroflexi bacterium]|nr:class I SAM-dependent methyltransferase [Chloroflexota bacterium]MBV9896753.1 class I SAM-dependent methyltransferase [Chloroflexota bacterium]
MNLLRAFRSFHGLGVDTNGKVQEAAAPPTELVERLIRELPKLHAVSQDDARWLTELGFPVEAGPVSWAVPPQVLRYFAEAVKPTDLTVETGAGQSTVALAALAKHHTCITIDRYCVDATLLYMEQIGIPRSKVTFVVESSDTALPKLAPPEKFDFAYIDGEHGYPFAALDWHFIDKHLKVGGIIGFDNVEVPSVHNHIEFLELNRTYRLVKNVSEPSLQCYGAYFYTKLVDQDRNSGSQLYNHRRVPGFFPQENSVWPWT